LFEESPHVGFSMLIKLILSMLIKLILSMLGLCRKAVETHDSFKVEHEKHSL
jgi:hypothetical protein